MSTNENKYIGEEFDAEVDHLINEYAPEDFSKAYFHALAEGCNQHEAERIAMREHLGV